MKKLSKRSKIHPSPPFVSDNLALLPAAILTLTAALSAEDREVLAYLISCSNSNTSHSEDGALGGAKHSPMFSCSCFCCYMSFWARWDASPNRELIHEIIESYEEESEKKKKRKEKKLGRRRRVYCKMEESKEGLVSDKHETRDSGGVSESEEVDGGDKGSVKRLLAFVGDGIWGLLNNIHY